MDHEPGERGESGYQIYDDHGTQVGDFLGFTRDRRCAGGSWAGLAGPVQAEEVAVCSSLLRCCSAWGRLCFCMGVYDYIRYLDALGGDGW